MPTKALRAINAIQSQVWATTEEKATEITGFLTRLRLNQRITKAESRQQFGAMKPRTPMRAGQVAVVPLYGTLCSRANQISAYSGGTSYESYVAAMEAAVAHGDVEAVITDGDSPGGAAEGAREAFGRLLALRGKKPIITVSNYMLASGALWVGSAADEVVASPSSMTGSVGVYTVHTDLTEAAAAQGVKHEVFRSAPNKGRGGAFEPLSEEERAHIQQMVGDYHRLFVADLARAYGTSTQRIESDFGGGWALTAQRAVKAKMVSRIATLEQVLAEYGVTRQPATGARALAPEQMAASSLAALGGWNAEWAPLARDVRTRVAVSVPAGLNGADVETIAAAVREASQTKMLAAGAEEGETCGECGEPLEDDGADGTFCPVCEPEIEGKEQASAGGAASANTNTPATEPAPEAKETTVSETATGPQAGAVNEALDTANAILSFADSLGYPAAQARDLAFKPGITTSSAHNILVTWKAEQQKGSTVTVTDVRDRDERPFASLGQQLIAVRAADMRSASEEQVNRLNAVNKIVAAASGTDSRVPADGGWAIMPQIAEGIVKKGWEEGKVLSRINVIPIGEGSNSLIRNQLKETSRTTGSRYGGVRIYRTSEASTVEGSKPAMRRQTILLEKLMGIYYATEEMLNDAAALSAEAEVGFQKELTFVKEDEVFRGKGNGQALGFLESDALVTVAKEAGQAAATVKAENVAKMMARLPASSFATAVWYINPSVLPQLVQMTIGNQPVFIPGGNLAGAPFGTLFGIPIEMAEYCSALGTVGDIVLVDLSQWTGITKGGANWQSSLHVRFLYDETAFKLTDRFNGQPDWEQAVTPFKGADTISPFIALATRA